MTYGFILANSTVDTVVPVLGEGEKLRQTFENLQDARKAAALATAALDLMRGTYSDCLCDILEGVLREVSAVFSDSGTIDELRSKVEGVISHQIEQEREETARW